MRYAGSRYCFSYVRNGWDCAYRIFVGHVSRASATSRNVCSVRICLRIKPLTGGLTSVV
jgi:hypothetical protein